jgi:hydroxymethylpyrimidine kinase/phosphomethylpyrimidine kinase
MKTSKAYCLSIAGHDPCDGAGLTSDVKTFQSIGLPTLSVCTSITFQNDDSFDGVEWMPVQSIVSQLQKLLGFYTIAAIKIGLVENFETLKAILSFIENHFAEGKKPFIVWDPILSASAGFQFHENVPESELSSILESVDLITPNIPEAQQLFPNASETILAQLPCSILLKGGHSTDDESKDVLFHDGKRTEYSAKRIDVKKHGTGCVLSAALCAYLAQDKTMLFAVQYAKDYLHKELLALASRKA